MTEQATPDEDFGLWAYNDYDKQASEAWRLRNQTALRIAGSILGCKECGAALELPAVTRITDDAGKLYEINVWATLNKKGNDDARLRELANEQGRHQ